MRKNRTKSDKIIWERSDLSAEVSTGSDSDRVGSHFLQAEISGSFSAPSAKTSDSSLRLTAQTSTNRRGHRGLRRYQQTHQGLFEHIWALSYLGEVRLRQGKAAEAETFFRQALEFAQRRWSANDFRLERLVTYINQARAATRR
jgi:hypothetical protein